MDPMLNFELPSGENVTVRPGFCHAVSSDAPAAAGTAVAAGPPSDFRVIADGVANDYMYGGSNPNSWNELKAFVFGGSAVNGVIPVVNFELPNGKDVTFRRDAIIQISQMTEGGAAVFNVRVPNWGYTFKYGGDNPASWNDLKTLIFGP